MKLLINEPPLQVLPSLAKLIGLKKALVLQQVHYWIENPKSGKKHDGRRWVYNSIRQWHEDNFSFWSVATVKRILSSLEEMGLIEVANLNTNAYDRTLWYTINYDQLVQLTQTLGHADPMDSSPLTPPIPETLTETTTENKNARARKPEPPPLPIHLAVPEMLNMWGEWLQYHEDRGKPLTRTTALKQFKRFEQMGIGAAVAAMDYSMEQSYTGLVQPKGNSKAPLPEPERVGGIY